MSEQTVEFADKTWQRSGGVWITAWEPPLECKLKFQRSVRIIGRHAFDDDPSDHDVAEVSQDQKAAAEHFFQHHAGVIDEVLFQILRYCRRIHQEDPVFFEDLAGVESVDQIAGQIDELQVAIEHHGADGSAWMSFTGGCDWEIEHGLGICVWKDIVLDIGTYDTVLSGPDPAHTCLPALDDAGREKTRKSVIETIAAIAESEARDAEQAALKSMPDPLRLSSALASGNAVLADQLVTNGVRLDAFPSRYAPPVFMAIQACDPELLKKMIELGAQTNVRGLDGQTPIAAAQQMLRGYRLSQSLQKGVLGDLSVMAGGESPMAGGLMSMLGNLQNEAAELLSQLEGERQPAPAWDDDKVNYHQDNIQNAANEVNQMIPKLEEIVQVLSDQK